MKIVKKMFRKIKVRGDKIFSIVSLFAMLANSFAPVLAAIPTYTYAEGIAAPVEVLTKEDKEEIKVEEKIESESVLKEEKNNETKNETESQSSEEVSEENQEGDILEDGVSDYRPEVEITEDEVKEVEEVSVLKETVNPANEINSNEEVTEATASAEEPVLENKEKEYKYLENGVVVDSTREDWSVDGEVAETKKVVKIGVKYIFPLDEDVSVTFTKLPKSEEDRAHLKIERVKVSDLNLPDDFKTNAEYAFDITTFNEDRDEPMENGKDFEYDLTLPRPEGEEVEVVYIEKSLEEIEKGLEAEEIKEVEEDNVEQKKDEEKVEVKDLDHFTLFIVTNPGPKLSTVMVNGMPYVSVPPSTNITVKLQVTTSGSGGDNNWRATGYKIDSGSWICINTSDHYSSGTYTEEFGIIAPSTVGSYNLSLLAYSENGCTGLVSNEVTLTDAIKVVTSSPSLTPPTLTENPSDPISLTSVSGVWTSISGGSGYQGIGTNEIRWGTPAGTQKSGLKFTNSGNQSFDTGETFYLGMLTHMNWPVQRGTAAKGATLQITLNFDRPDIDDVVLDYDFDIEETPNEEGNCKVYQRTLTPCDDKVTFPNKYGTKVFTIGDIQYTLVIDGFVDAYPGGNPVDAFITEERKDNSAFLVGHLSSVLVERPEIRLTKKTNNQDISAAPGPNLYVGDAVEWKYIVQNSGNVTLSNINITDNPATDITCYSDEAYTTALSSPYTLASGQYMYCKALGTVTEGQYKNTATVTGTPPTGNNVSASDSSWYYGVQQKGHIIVDKVTNPAGDSQSFSFTTTGNGYNSFSLTDAAEPNNQELVAGTYSVTETVPAGWHSTASCTSSIAGKTQDPSALSLASGETINCTFTNTKYGSLTIVKNANPSSEEEFSFTTTGTGLSDFTLTDDSDTTNPSKVFNNLSSGTYSVSEGTLPSGWYLDSAVCSDQSPVSAIDLSVGENIICTFNNVKYGSISGRKLNDLDGNADTAGDRYPVSGYTIFIDANNNGKLDPGETSTETASDGTYSFTNLKPGTYTVVEVLKVGWIVLPNESTSQSVTIAAGGNKKGIDFINVKYGSIQVLKNVDGNGDGDLDDDVDVKGATDWEWLLGMDTNTNAGIHATGQTVKNLLPGVYKVSETQKNGYHVTSLVCTNNGQEIVNQASESVKITLRSGDDVVCTFTNAKDIGTLIVKKVVNNDNGGSKVASDFSFKIGDSDPVKFESDGQNEITVNAGTYTITEPAVSGYLTSYSNCSNVVVPNGGTQTCTITNDDTAPKLTVFKHVVNDNGGTATANDFDIKLNDTELTFGIWTGGVSQNTSIYVSYPEVKSNTQYTLTEIDHLGYKEGKWDCVDDKTQKSISHPFTLVEGQNVTCTIKNDDIAPELQLVKEIKNDNGGSAKVEDFTLKAGDITFTSGVSQNVNAGTYTLSETGPEGYQAGKWSCTNGIEVDDNSGITLGIGQSTVCTITNDDVAPTLKLVKNVDNGNGGPSSSKDWTLTATGDGGFSDKGDSTTFHEVKAGVAYTLSESDVTGYTSGNWECDGGTFANDTITLGLADNVTCTITNTYSPVCIDNKNIGADIVASVVEGKRYDGGPIAEDRTNPGNALGVADEKFYSLGEGGKIVLAFTGYVENVAGNDFSIHEITWGRESYVEERAEVWVAKNIIGIDDEGWVKLGEASNHSEDGITYFDFGSTGLPWIRAVKLVESSVNQTDGDGFDLDAIVAASHVCKEPSVSKVEICKVDNKNRPQKDWEVVLASEKVDGPTSINVRDDSGTDSKNLPAGKYLIKVSGTYRYGNSSMNADAGFSHRPNGIPSGCDCWLDGREISGGLMARINGNETPVNWGAYNEDHIYTYVYDHDGGKINISIRDDIYGDNVNNNNFQFEIFRIPVGYYGTTGGNGCVTLENVLYGDYILDETLKDGWINVSGKGDSVSVDASEEEFKLINRKDAPVTIVATKIVCDYEGDLPNWGYGAPVNITKDTASNFLSSHPSCRLEPDWSFQWGNDKSVNPGDAHTGPASGWNTFGPTDINGVATVNINDFGTTSQIKVREVLKENYFPFTYLTNGSTNDNNVSAEIYCDVDVLNYDNDDRITPEYGNTYYCVAWNVQNYGSIQGEKYNDVNANGNFDDVEKRLDGWTINLYDLNWKLVDSMKTGENEAGEGQYNFTNLLAGTYHVCEEQQEGWYQTYPASGSQYEGKGPYCHTVNLDPGQAVTNIQFGNYQGSDVTVCKLDVEENRLPGWKIVLRGSNPLENISVTPDGGVYSSSDLDKGNYALISYGTYEYRGNTGLLTDPGYSERLVTDGYTGPYFPWINVMDLKTTGALGIMINGNPTNWGEYLSDDHRYALGFSDYENKFNFSVYDNIYPDNVGAMYVDIYNGYVGVTQEDGCYTFKNVPFGTYQVDEVMKDGWRNVSGLEEVTVDESTENFNIVNELKVYDIHGYKWSDLDGDGTLDSEEPLLSGWRIFIDKNENSVWDADEPSMLTTDDDEHYGWFWFEDLLPGQYRVCEEIPSDWVQTYPGSIDSPQCHIVDLPSGASSEWTVNMVEGPEYNFGNLQKGDITVYKFNDLNGNGEWDEEEPFLQDWDINISKLDTMSNTQVTDEDGKAVFRLLPDSYILSETMQEGWEQTGIYCEDTAEGVLITSPEEAYGHHGKCEGWNGCGNAETCALWACEVNGYSNLISYGDQRPCTRFNMCHLFSDLTPGYPYDEYINGHRIDWNWGNGCDVMGVTDIYCSNENGSIRRIADLSLASNVYHDEVYNLNVRPGDRRTCYIGNIENSELRVSETNDSWPNTLGIGDVFTYTIKVKAINGPVKDVVMTNLPPKGIEPQLGTFKAVSDKRGDLGSTGVVYASPGDWNLGNMEKDEVVTITYEAKVAANVDPGIYPDVSFAQGKGMGGSSLLALSEGSGFDINDGIVDENFVGTQVKIAVEKEMEDEVNVKEKKEGDVLGASTKLPATGANTMWLTILLIIASVGGLLLLIGGFGSMSTKKQKEIKKGNKVILGILTFGLVSLFSYKVFAADPVVRLSQPQSPASSEFNLVFVAMDVEDRKMTAQCWIQKPGASFESFGSSITIDSGKSGDSRICPVTESDLTSEGEYKFLVKVTPEDGSEISSNIVTVAYDGTGPDKPKYIEKEKINKCVNKITLKTADDGETSLVRVYADGDKEIDIDDSHKIETESIGPNKKFEFEHLMSGDDCGKTWYYAVVAFDDAGNASKPRSEVLTTTVTTTEEKEEETGAIPVEGGAGVAGVGGEVAGEGATGPEGAGGTEDTEEGKPLEVGVGEGEEGSVLGEKTGEEGKTLFKSAWFWIAAAGLGILIISATKKSKKN